MAKNMNPIEANEIHIFIIESKVHPSCYRMYYIIRFLLKNRKEWLFKNLLQSKKGGLKDERPKKSFSSMSAY